MSKNPLFTDLDTYDTMITATTAAIARTVLLGEQTRNESGGSIRESREATLKMQTDFLKLLQEERKELAGTAPEKSVFLGPVG